MKFSDVIFTAVCSLSLGYTTSQVLIAADNKFEERKKEQIAKKNEYNKLLGDVDSLLKSEVKAEKNFKLIAYNEGELVDTVSKLVKQCQSQEKKQAE